MIHLRTRNPCKSLKTNSWNICLTLMGLISYLSTSSFHAWMWFLHSIQCPLNCTVCWILPWAIQYPYLSFSPHNLTIIWCFLITLGKISPKYNSTLGPYSIWLCASLLSNIRIQSPTYSYWNQTELHHTLVWPYCDHPLDFCCDVSPLLFNFCSLTRMSQNFLTSHLNVGRDLLVYRLRS